MKSLNNIFNNFGKSGAILAPKAKNLNPKTNHQSIIGQEANGQIIQKPIRKGSLSLRQAALYFRPFNKKDIHRFLLTAEKYEKQTKQKGQRMGALGQSGILVLRELLRLIDYKTGRLDPAINTLAKRINIAPKTVCAALKRLKEHGFINWVRRYQITNAQRKFGLPQLKQATNAYILHLPKIAEKLLGKIFQEPPIPEDFEYEKAQKEEIYKKQFSELSYGEKLQTQNLDEKLHSILEKFEIAAKKKFGKI